MRARPERGLYDPRDEQDSCGFRLVTRAAGSERANVDQASTVLSRMTHRGGVSADGHSGDGCGVLLAGVDGFVRDLAADAGLALDDALPCASGLVFRARPRPRPTRAAGAGSNRCPAATRGLPPTW